MTYSILRFAHFIGVMLMGAGLIGVWLSDLRSRKVQDLVLFAEAVRYITVFYDGGVVPGAVILFVSDAWMTALHALLGHSDAVAHRVARRHPAGHLDPIHHRHRLRPRRRDGSDNVDPPPVPVASPNVQQTELRNFGTREPL